MAYRLIQEFTEKLHGDHAATFTGPFSLLILQISWSRNPSIPIDLFSINQGRQTVFAVDEYWYNFCGETKLKEYLAKKVTIDELEKEYADFNLKVQSLYDKVTTENLSKISEDDLLTLLNESISAFEPLVDTVYIETLNYDMVLESIGEGKKELLDKIWDRATHPTFISFEGRWLAYLIIQLKDEADTSSLVRKVKYIYTDYHWTKNESEIKQILDDLKINISEKEKELDSFQKDFEERRLQYQKWLDTLSTEEKFISEYIQLVMKLRDLRKDPIAKVQAALIEIVSELLKRAGIEEKYGTVLNMYECKKGIEYLKNIKEELARRMEGNIGLVRMNVPIEIELCDYKEAVEEFYRLIGKDTEPNSKELKGQIANKGNATGRVRIVLDPQNPGDFAKGDILVTSMTRPEFVSIMKKAGAVVTNEGGITCHAAIVSRELNIPCIIGTRTATRFLKDGDMVEVDAEKGIVRIIN